MHLMRVIVWFLGLYLLAAGPVLAQTPGNAPATQATELEALLQTLEDPQQRARLIQQIELLMQAQDAIGPATEASPAAAAEPTASMADAAQADGQAQAQAEAPADAPADSEAAPEGAPDEQVAAAMEAVAEDVTAFATWLQQGLAQLLDFAAIADWLLAQVNNPEARKYWLKLSIQIAFVLGLAAAGAWLVQKSLPRLLVPLPDEARMNLETKLAHIARRFGVRLAALIAFVFSGFLGLQLTQLDPGAAVLARSILITAAAVMAVSALNVALLSPAASALRIVPLDDEAAAFVGGTFERFAFAIAASYIASNNEFVLRLPHDLVELIERLAVLIIVITAIWLIFRLRKPLGRFIRGADEDSAPGSLRSLLARIWHWLALGYVIASYIIYAFEVEGGIDFLIRGTIATLLLILIARPLASALSNWFDRKVYFPPELQARFPALEKRINRYRRILHRFAATVVYLGLIYLLAQAWDIKLRALISGVLGDHLSTALSTALTVGAFILLVWEVIDLVIETYLTGRDEQGFALVQSSRTRTILPLTQTFVAIGLLTIFAIAVLTSLQLDLAPLLAAAGVVGIALGFGSQRLVQDVINGAFILFQDIIAVGDVVKVGGYSGEVERISIRTLALRDLEGNLHTIPFSEVGSVTNMARDFAYALISASVSYSANTDDAVAALKSVGEDMQSATLFKKDILGPLEVLGVDSFGNDAVIIMVRLRTRPLRQWAVKREFNRRMKQRFDELGIEIPFSQVTLHFADNPGAMPFGPPPPASQQVPAQPSKPGRSLPHHSVIEDD